MREEKRSEEKRRNEEKKRKAEKKRREDERSRSGLGPIFGRFGWSRGVRAHVRAHGGAVCECVCECVCARGGRVRAHAHVRCRKRPNKVG